MKIRHKQRGFTLIEVLIAVVIIAIGMSAVISSATNSVRVSTHLREQLALRWAASNIIARMRCGQLTPTDAAKTARQATLLGMPVTAITTLSRDNPDSTIATVTIRSTTNPALQYATQAYISKAIPLTH